MLVFLTPPPAGRCPFIPLMIKMVIKNKLTQMAIGAPRLQPHSVSLYALLRRIQAPYYLNVVGIPITFALLHQETNNEFEHEGRTKKVYLHHK
jgi:hypothetical protein